MSLRDTILTADDLAESVEDIPEWGVKLKLRGMTGKQRIRLVEGVSAKGKDREFMYSDILIATVLVPELNEKGENEPVFDKADREALAGKAGGVLERLALKVMKLSGVSIEDAEAEIDADPTSAGA